VRIRLSTSVRRRRRPFDPKVGHEYGYGRMQNVVTSMDYERLMCTTGPYEGEILRASDKKHPHRIAWIQCVGSRQVNPPSGNSYCSAVCCKYTQKQVILTKEHDAEAECTIFHNDIRSPMARILSDSTKEQRDFQGFDL
jgi:heterodisulfide reductase subunit A